MTEEKSVVQAAEDSLGVTLLRALLAEIQQQQSPWQSMSESQQQECLDRLGAQVTAAAHRAVQTIASGGFSHIGAQIESLTIKDGAKATLLLARGSNELHELADRVGTFVLILFADGSEYTDGMHTIRAEADQRLLPLPDAPDVQASSDEPKPKPKRIRKSRAKSATQE